MSFIGIISDEKTENCIRDNILDKLNLRESSVLFIKEKSIENIKNIKFDTIIIERKFQNLEILKKMIGNARYLIVNSDIKENLNLIKNVKPYVISFGFNSEATITVSSVDEEETLICVQKAFKNKENLEIEPQEIRMKICQNASCTMALAAILLINNKI